LKQPSWSVFFLGGGVRGRGGEGRGCWVFCNIFEGDLGELVFQQNFTSFMKSKNWTKKKKGKKSILGH
jgi:hypothetical protein